MRSSLSPGIRAPHLGLALLRDLVHEQTGLYFDDAKIDMFLEKLLPLVLEHRFDSLLDYYHLLKYDPASADEWRKVFDALTVQESFFWRELDQIRVLVDRIVPQYFSAHPYRTLNIWSAACATGCEPLTIAMALHEAGWFDRGDIDIFATDASHRAIGAARNGVYRERSFRSLPPDLREKYFICENGAVDGLSRVSGGLHSRVRWGIANLASETDLVLTAMNSPVIFCRNVFIYFSQRSVEKTVRIFAEHMPRPGYLFVGMTESLLKISSVFESREIGDAFVYVKE
jgi:chemotaxis protein methyltransferase CheR